MEHENIYFDFDDIVTDLHKIVKELVRFIHNYDAPETLNLYCLDEQEKYGGVFKHGDVPITEKDIHHIIASVMIGNVNLLPCRTDAYKFIESFARCSFYSKKTGFVFNALTARNKIYKNVLDDWIKNRINFTFKYKLTFASGNGGLSHKKPELLKSLGATHYVEDQYCVAKGIADNGIIVFLLNKPYNQGLPEHEKIIRIDSLFDIENHISLKGKV